MAKLSLQNMKKVYENGFVAVKDITLDIEDKEFVVLVGPSGCGKSTVLRMIAGLEEISEGTLYIGDEIVNEVQPKDRDIAMVFQNYALYPHMTIYDNMAFGLKLKKTPKDEIKSRVTEAAKILSIEDLLDRKPKQLSGGQRQRVALGRAIVRKPKVFLMDEPLSNLDAKLRVQMRTEISKLHNQLQTTFVYVTHDQTEAMTMGTRIVVMKDGNIQQVDTPQIMYKRPKNLFVASFIGSPEINILDGTVLEEKSRIVIKIKNGIKFNLPEDKENTLREQGYVGKDIKIGIRPEHILEYDPEDESEDLTKFESTIVVTEMMGAETYLFYRFNDKQTISRVKSSTKLTVGDDGVFRVKGYRILMFDPDSELALY